MKIKRYIICTVFVLIIFILNLILISEKKHLLLNSNININSFMAEYDYEKLRSYIDDKFLILESELEINRNIKYEKKLISYSKEVTEKLFDNTITPDIMLQKYFVREPFRMFGDFENFYDSGYGSYSNKYDYFYKFKSKIINENITYGSISNIKLYYTYPDYYILQVYLNDVKKLGNIILQYKIIEEDSSGMLKISDILYFNESYLDECYDNDSNIKRFNIENIDDMDYIPDEKVLNVYNSYKDNLAKINVYKDDKLIDTVTGFFLDEDILITTFDIFNNGIFEKYNYVIINSKEESASYKSIVSFSGYYNIAVIKIDKKIGKKAEILYATYGIKDESVIVPSISGNVYVGVVNDNPNMYNNITNSNLLLNSIDRGSPIINKNGILIGINTRINPKSNILMSVNMTTVLNIYSVIRDGYSYISSFKLDSDTIKIR